MSWKANFAGLSIFITGTALITAANMGDYDSPVPSTESITSEELSNSETNVINQIAERMSIEYGIQIDESQAKALNCKNIPRAANYCYHRDLLTDSSVPPSSRHPETATEIVKTFGTIEVEGQEFTLERFTNETDFDIRKK